MVGKTVRYCVENGKDLPELTLEEFRQFSKKIDADIFAAITLEASVNARRATGGTARAAVEREIARARQTLAVSLNRRSGMTICLLTPYPSRIVPRCSACC